MVLLVLEKVSYTRRLSILSKKSSSQIFSTSHEGSAALLITFLDNVHVIKQTKISWKKNSKKRPLSNILTSEISGEPNKGLRVQLRQSRNQRGDIGPVHFIYRLSYITAPKSA